MNKSLNLKLNSDIFVVLFLVFLFFDFLCIIKEFYQKK
ncbi:hypothetical protein SPONN_796 [uncultured Candidatus Thioglobus sp.]|nr:hypothetical protein SPONN_796 [uncultured Candidatus Thioglobus sp.]